MLVSPPIVAPTSCAVVEVDSGAMFGYTDGRGLWRRSLL